MADNNLIGHKIVDIIHLTKKERDELGWYESPVVLVLDNGIKLFPSGDEEGNNHGTLFGINKNGDGFLLG